MSHDEALRLVEKLQAENQRLRREVAEQSYTPPRPGSSSPIRPYQPSWEAPRGWRDAA